MSGVDQGTLYALGLGPGDPGLVTVRAAELLGAIDTVAFPVDAGGRPGRAFDIAAPYLREGVGRLPLDIPMTTDQAALERAWDEAVAALSRETATGRDVAYLCLGDTLLYGSFGYLLARYEGPVDIVPGVISPVAAAGVVGASLVEGREPLVIVPDGGDAVMLESALALGGAVVIMKPSRVSAAGAAVLEEAGALERAWVVEEATRSGERAYRVEGTDGLTSLPYFSIVIVSAVRDLPAGRAEKGVL